MSKPSARMRRSKYNATIAVAANGTVKIDEIAFATDCVITSALALSFVRVTQTNSAESPTERASTRNCAIQTTPKETQNFAFVSANDRPSDLNTPTPSSRSAGIATAQATCSQMPGMKHSM